MCVLPSVSLDPTGRHNRLLQAATQLTAEQRQRTSLVAVPPLRLLEGVRYRLLGPPTVQYSSA